MLRHTGRPVVVLTRPWHDQASSRLVLLALPSNASSVGGTIISIRRTYEGQERLTYVFRSILSTYLYYSGDSR